MKDILHCDLNGFFASVECVKNPALKNVPMAVCGDPKLRHGVILAKNELAKQYNIQTAESVYAAKKKCPNLVLVQGSHEDYSRYSHLVNQIYLKYTERVEPCSIDESFLDVTESKSLFGSPYEIAYRIKEEVKNTLGLTISVGVSFNRLLAKMGSDYKKPDAITVFSPDNFREKLFPMPIDSLLFAGRATCEKLKKMRIDTIGDLARSDIVKIAKKFGKLGVTLHHFANGMDSDFIKHYDDHVDPKSVSKGITLANDTNEREQIITVIQVLTSYIAKTLRRRQMKCALVSLSLKDSMFTTISKQKTIFKTDLFQEIASVAIHILNEMYTDGRWIRAITVTVSHLESPREELQLDVFSYLNHVEKEEKEKEKLQKVTKVVDTIQDRFGKTSVNFASVLTSASFPSVKKE